MEKELQKKVVKFLRSIGAYVLQTLEERARKRGFEGNPDIIACLRGKFVAIELKSPTIKDPRKALRLSQKGVLQKIKEAGGYTLVTNNLDDVINFINKVVLKSKAHSDDNTDSFIRF